MLRTFFDEPKRRDDGLLLRTNRAIDQFGKRLRHLYSCDGGVPEKWIRLDLWADGLKHALNELEQSIFCCAKYAAGVPRTRGNGTAGNSGAGNGLTVEDLSEEERDHYYRHIYFYKNAFIRVFSILDKTGYFLDTLFEARTAEVKPKFSYFTVLRRMHETGLHPELEERLYRLKVRYRQPLDRLRRQRNLEIHSMNVELIDELWQRRSCFAEYHHVEPLEDHLADLAAAFEMVCGSLHEIFTYCTANLPKNERAGFKPKRS